MKHGSRGAIGQMPDFAAEIVIEITFFVDRHVKC
jgi:hypothetical protein